MTDLRKDPILDHWVLMAANRSQRPGAFIESPPFERGLPCPFCEGHEAETPHEALAFRNATSAADRPGWRVRVVPNKFPAIDTCDGIGSIDMNAERQRECDPPTPPTDAGMCRQIEGCGAHEVIIESPRHVSSTSDLSAAEIRELFLSYQLRLAYWKRDPRMVYGQVFKNVGQAAGASLEHTHSQLLMIPRVPTVIAAEMTGSLNYFRQHGGCSFCDMVRNELAGGQRIVIETTHHLSFAPFAARLPFETWILPKSHASHYEDASREQVEDLASIVQSVIRRLEAAVGRCAYNYVLHTTPFDTNALAHYHWHIEVVPSLAKTAGFELGTGWYINLVTPEESARRMRETGNSE
jgi:UDPglucose--hexose-1-phosphate uridylyltransferase